MECSYYLEPYSQGGDSLIKGLHGQLPQPETSSRGAPKPGNLKQQNPRGTKPEQLIFQRVKLCAKRWDSYSDVCWGTSLKFWVARTLGSEATSTPEPH